MKTNSCGMGIIKSFEQLHLEARRMIDGTLVIGYGHTGKEVAEGSKITEDEAEALLVQDLMPIEADVKTLLGAATATENQFSAMVCLAHGIGVGMFKTSTVLRRHKEGKTDEAAQGFMLWSSREDCERLAARRQAERVLYQTVTT